MSYWGKSCTIICFDSFCFALFYNFNHLFLIFLICFQKQKSKIGFVPKWNLKSLIWPSLSHALDCCSSEQIGNILHFTLPFCLFSVPLQKPKALFWILSSTFIFGNTINKKERITRMKKEVTKEVKKAIKKVGKK